jgi:hypothetical protein
MSEAPTKCWCGGRVAPAVAFPMNGTPYICLDSKFHDPTATGRPDKIEKIYIAGPMTGYPDCNYPEFHRVDEALRTAGYDVVNPASFGEGRHYVDFIREDLRMMLDCHAVATLNNWWESVGARNEVQVAGVLKMPVKPWQTWVLESSMKSLRETP